MRPFHRNSSTELVKQPQVYGFDTGFVSFDRGWNPLRSDDLDDLWEHVVLETIQARLPDTPPHCLRDKRGREIDFVIPRNHDTVDDIE